MRTLGAAAAVALSLTAVSVAAPSIAAATPAVPQLQVTGDVVRGLDIPWGLDFLPGGDALVTERATRRILRVAPQGQVQPVGEIPEADGPGEGGLLGIVVSPTFATDSLVYIYYSTTTENRIERMQFDGTAFGPRTAVVTGIPAAIIHNGGAIKFGPDGMLYASTGDANNGLAAQDQASLAGKILRMTPDGTPPPDNPFPGSLVYSMGHRNVQGIAFDSSQRLWASELGNTLWDELNRIRPGGNYGWPQVEGMGENANAAANGSGGFIQPAAVWPTADASPSGITIVGDVIYMAALRGQRLWEIPITEGGVGEPVPALQGEHGRLRTPRQAPDGSLWITTSNRDGGISPSREDDRILRVTLDATQP
jgi:glucose/arabinose dehydrogenase